MPSSMKIAFAIVFLLSTCFVRNDAFGPVHYHYQTNRCIPTARGSSRATSVSQLQMSKEDFDESITTTSVIGNPTDGDDDSAFKYLKTMGAQLHSMLDVTNDGKLDLEDVKVAVHSILDVNNDGKVDIEDVKAALSSLLDVNRDGKLDVKDIKAAISIALMTGALVLSPQSALAKGGGGHGGGHGHSNSSHGRSSSSWGVDGGSYSAEDIPIDGGVLAVAVASTLFEITRDETFDDEFFALVKETCGDDDPPKDGDLPRQGKGDDDEEVGETITTKSLHKKGVYKEIEQDSRADLAFRSDGTVTGKGFDYIDDGPYAVRGKWRGIKNDKSMVRWTEEYEEGFSTMVRGTYSKDTISARYVSNRAVRGEVRLVYSGPLDESGLIDKVKDAFL
eukprot:CAMPEP_0183708618 /NCGR_PEP_ID=MMETSP0737-20130205/4866_1 /TAXON_ID=385413 /ORGANISM="Thalassiosira miniscula, Strain CCMP1093" /LENGTH=390 /DNA_ID=CAMNT_0025936513 /DNA_START=393 /DNA_END=1568 /DNA_ORIENTATION=-